MTAFYANLSGGLASAVMVERAFDRYGKDQVRVRFADTLWEDEDLYRFLNDLEAHWGVAIQRVTDGRTPLQVAEKRSLIPNSRIAPCSYELKGKLLEAATPLRGIILIGLDWREMHRVEKVRIRFEKAERGVDFPLLWQPHELTPYYTVVESWGIRPPRLYDAGLTHNNCGGRCVRQGMAQWLALKASFPERFEEMRQWEEDQRAKGGARANKSFLTDRTGGERRPITLTQLLARPDKHVVREEVPDDQSSCACNDWEGEQQEGIDE